MNTETLDVKSSQAEKLKNWLKDCYRSARKSNHPSTHNAALLIKNEQVILSGLNILPPGVKFKKERFQGKAKHTYLNHAERDLLYNAARKGISTKNLTMVMPWLPCVPCANAIITAGIKKLVIHKQMVERTDEKWREELENALQLMREADIEIVAYDGLVGEKAYMHSTEWEA